MRIASLRSVPFRLKVPLAIILTSTLLLVLISGFLLVYESMRFKAALVSETGSLARVVGANCAAAAVFEDSWAAGEILSGLKGGDNVRRAVLYSRSGQALGTYTRTPDDDWKPPAPMEPGATFIGDTYLSWTEIGSEGERAGTLFLEVDAGAIRDRLRNYAFLIGYVFLVALGLTILISSRTQAALINPVIRLAEAARHVSRRQDYAVRIPAESEDEIGDLVQAFNEMLGEIEMRDYRLELAREDLQTHIAYIEAEMQERKKAENELSLKEAQLRQAQKMEAIGILAGGVAHDFNNILTAILGYSQLLLYRIESDNPMRESVTEIQRAAERAASLTRQLLAFSRHQVLQPQVVQLNRLIEDMQKMLTRLIGEDIEFVTSLSDGLDSVFVDPGELEQVVLNLIVNSRDAMPGGGMLIVETRTLELESSLIDGERGDLAPGRYVVLSITDTGVGMTPEVRSRIFDPFYTTKELGKGTGLGLSTVYGIVKQSGGHVSVYSEPNQGTTFKIYFPSCSAQENGTTSGEAAPVPGGPETILVVEDEVPVRRVVTRVLGRVGYTVLEAADQEEALNLCRDRTDIDLLITDVVMPRMNGRELSERAASLRPDLRVLFMSGYTDDAVILKGVLEARMPFLGKPFTTEQLLTRVREVLDEDPVRKIAA